jgi:phage shock protein E
MERYLEDCWQVASLVTIQKKQKKMIQLIKNILGIGPKADLKELVKNGAVILDVRSKGEFQSGHVKGAVNIPLDTIESNISKLKRERPIITCCASGMRSGSAKNILINKGFKTVHNGGSWINVQNKIA